MDVAVTGSTGMIGRALGPALTERGHTVVPVVRRPVAEGERAVRWDVDRMEIDAAALEGVDAVVHLAGEGIAEARWTDDQKRRILESRTHGTSLLAEALAGLERKPAVLVSSSGIGFYGDRGDEELTEVSGPGDDFIADVCVRWEASTGMAAEAGIRVALTRTGIVLDADEGALAKQLLPFKLGVGGRLGSGRQWMSWITLADEVAAICHLLEHDVSGPVNLVAPNPVRNAEFADSLGRVLKRPTLLPIPTFAPAVLYGKELVESLLLASQRVRPTRLEESGFTFQHPDLEPALRAVLGR